MRTFEEREPKSANGRPASTHAGSAERKALCADQPSRSSNVRPFGVPTRDRQLEQRLRELMDVLAVAQGELATALLAGDLDVAKIAARKLSSVGWLFKDAADRHEGYPS